MKCKNCLRLIALPVGLICLSFSIFQDRFLPETGLYGFLQGFLFGIGVIFTGFYLLTSLNRKKNEQDN
jgi:hypothetical protein